MNTYFNIYSKIMIKNFEQFFESKKDNETGLPNGFDNISEIPLTKDKKHLKSFVETNIKKEPNALIDVDTKEVESNAYQNSIYSEDEFIKHNKRLAMKSSHKGFTVD